MPPLAMVGELYLISTGIGCGYLIISFLMGQFDGQGDGSSGDGSDAGGADASGADISGADAGGADAGGADAGGADVSSGDAADTGSSTSLLPVSQIGAGHPLPITTQRRGRLLFTLLSPMTISMFLAFFGIAGLILSSKAAFLGPFTIIPALLIGFLITRTLIAAMRSLSTRMHVSSVVRVQDLVGQVGKITVSISGDGKGQISYSREGMRCTAIARAAKAGTELTTGTKVIITDLRDRVAYVEPWTDPDDPAAATEKKA